jgi:hypothetical protein
LIRIAVEKHLGELKQRRIATTRAEPKKIDLGEPVAFWTRGDEEFADKVIQQHFDEDAGRKRRIIKRAYISSATARITHLTRHVSQKGDALAHAQHA